MTLPFRQIHLDCHTPKLPFTFGNKFNKKVFQKTLKDAYVNSITLTGRCHHGHIYYETKLEAKHPNLNNDFLMEVVDACHEINIRCPIYLTVGWDDFMTKKHPEWLSIDKDGRYFGFEDYGQLEAGWKKICFNSPYIDYLALQIRDIMKHFSNKLDGLFFDILWQDSCYCNHCLTKMKRLDLDPKKEADVKQFARLTEVKTKETIAKIVTDINPTCPIFFNEGNITPAICSSLKYYSHIEIESLPSASWGYQHFSATIRYVKNLGKEYLGMTACFHRGWADFGSYKNLAALEYECFLSLAHGGKCSIGDQMKGDGTLNPISYARIGQVYQEVKKRERFAKDVESTATIAILHPGIIEITEQKVDYSLGGTVSMLNELHYQSDVIDDQMKFEKYALLILPDKIYLSDILEKKLYNYWKQGGKILLSYHSGLKSDMQYPSWMGLSYLGECDYQPTYIYYPEIFEAELLVHGKSVYVQSKNKEEATLALPMYQRTYQHFYGHYHAPVMEMTNYPALVITDGILFCSHNIFEVYRLEEVSMLRDALFHALKKLIGEPEINLENFPKYGDIILNYQPKENRLILNLLYYLPTRRGLNIDTIEDKVPLYNIKIRISKELIKRYSMTEIDTIYLPLANQELEISEEEPFIYFTVPKIDGYEIVVLNLKS